MRKRGNKVKGGEKARAREGGKEITREKESRRKREISLCVSESVFESDRVTE